MVKSGTSFTVYVSDTAGSFDATPNITLTSSVTFALAQFGPVLNRELALVNVKAWSVALTAAQIRIERDSFALTLLAGNYSQAYFNVPADFTDRSGNAHDWTQQKRYSFENPIALVAFSNPPFLS